MSKLFSLLFIILYFGLIKTDLENDFKNFKSHFNKTYQDDSEELKRFEIFKNNTKFINNHNNDASKGKYSFSLGINQFSDLVSFTILFWFFNE
jgi:hypothetical protein